MIIYRTHIRYRFGKNCYTNYFYDTSTHKVSVIEDLLLALDDNVLCANVICALSGDSSEFDIPRLVEVASRGGSGFISFSVARNLSNKFPVKFREVSSMLEDSVIAAGHERWISAYLNEVNGLTRDTIVRLQRVLYEDIK